MELVSSYPPSTKITPPHQQLMFLSWRFRFYQVQYLFEETNMTFNSSTYRRLMEQHHQPPKADETKLSGVDGDVKEHLGFHFYFLLVCLLACCELGGF
jgi:hypothetical protein